MPKNCIHYDICVDIPGSAGQVQLTCQYCTRVKIVTPKYKNMRKPALYRGKFDKPVGREENGELPYNKESE